MTIKEATLVLALSSFPDVETEGAVKFLCYEINRLAAETLALKVDRANLEEENKRLREGIEAILDESCGECCARHTVFVEALLDKEVKP